MIARPVVAVGRVDVLGTDVSVAAGPEQVAAVRKAFGLDRPLPEQYVIYLTKLTRGDLGVSMRTSSDVGSDLREYFPATLELTGAAMVATIVMGIPLGLVAAIRRVPAEMEGART